MAEAERISRHALSEVRAAVTGFRTANLAAELASARLLLESAGTLMTYQLPMPPPPAAAEDNLTLILREAVTNVARHAGATQADVVLRWRSAHLEMTVRDNGRGGLVREGSGLAGMRERAGFLGGELVVESPRGQGTLVRVSIPLSIPASVADSETTGASSAGQATQDIAARLHLSQGTVRNYLSEAIGKLGAANRIEAHRLARQKGWL